MSNSDEIKPPRFRSTGFALLDIGHGRHALAKYFEKRRNEKKRINVPVNPPIKITIEAEIVDQWGGDDGISIEFEAKIISLKLAGRDA